MAVGLVVGARRRTAVAVLLGTAALACVVGAWAAAKGFDRPVIAAVLATALAGANLVPYVSVQGGRLSAFTPVSALLVPIGLLLPAGEAILAYALGETLGVIASHRLEPHVGGPASQPVARTTITVGKSILGGALAILAMGEIAGAGSPVAVQLTAAVVGVTVASVFDHLMVAVVAVVVRGADLATELGRDLREMITIGAGEIVIGAVIAILAVRDIWSLVLGLAAFALVVAASSGYARAAAERRTTDQLLELAEGLQAAEHPPQVLEVLRAHVQLLLPEDPVVIRSTPPDDREQGWLVRIPEGEDQWLVIPRIVDTRDYEEQSVAPVDIAASMAGVAVERAALQERLVVQDRLRRLVLSTVAHDLGGPLMAASGALEMLTGASERVAAGDRERLLEMATRGVSRIGALVDDLLRLEAAGGSATEGECDIRDVVAELVADLTDEDVVIEVELQSARAAMDAVSVGRIVDNLLRNAVKFSPPGGTITVSGGPRGDSATIVIEDEGPGVPEAERPRIFDAFEQLDSSRGGVGLGLYIAGEFARRNGGRMWVDSASGGGAAFHVVLPSR